MKNLITRMLLMLALAPFTVCAAAASGEQPPWSFQDVNRVVAVGDVHGALPQLQALLRGTGLMNAEGRWIGGDAHFVSVGDLVDRGAESRKIMDLLMRLQNEARQAGGRVHVVPGNHEVMNITDDLRYVSAEEYAAFAAEEDPRERERVFKAYLASQPDPSPDGAGEAAQAGTSPDEAAVRAMFAKRYPPGYFAHRKAFSISGPYGKWIAQLPFLIRVNDTIFVHGGLPPVTARMPGERLNAQMHKELRAYFELSKALINAGIFASDDDHDARLLAVKQRLAAGAQASAQMQAAREAGASTVTTPLPAAPKGQVLSPELQEQLEKFAGLQAALIFSDQGPLWYRGSAWCHPLWESLRAEAALGNLGARRVAIGHTPTATRRVTSRLDGRVIMMDTGMLPYYEGRPSALEISGQGLRVYYADDELWSEPDVENRSVGKRPAGMSDEDIEAFLGSAEVVESEELGMGVTRPLRLTLSQGDTTLRAVFKSEDTDTSGGTGTRANFRLNIADSYKNDIAAYRIDKFLGIDMVPVTVEREFDGRLGALQFWVENSISDLERREQNVPIYPLCDIQEQYDLMRILDILIYNEDRNQTNVLFDREWGTVRLIDHSRSFRTHRGRPPIYKDSRVRMPARLQQRLQALDRETLHNLVGDLLERKQLRALLKRRDEILKQAEVLSGWSDAEGVAG